MNANPEHESNTAAPAGKKILIVALGGCGAKTLNAFARLPGTGVYQTLLLETDKESAAHCTAGEILRTLRNSRKAPGCSRIYTAGEKEYDNYVKRSTEGVPVNEALQKTMKELQKEYHLDQYHFDF